MFRRMIADTHAAEVDRAAHAALDFEELEEVPAHLRANPFGEMAREAQERAMRDGDDYFSDPEELADLHRREKRRRPCPFIVEEAKEASDDDDVEDDDTNYYVFDDDDEF